jgi:hypothetical protein
MRSGTSCACLGGGQERFCAGNPSAEEPALTVVGSDQAFVEDHAAVDEQADQALWPDLLNGAVAGADRFWAQLAVDLADLVAVAEQGVLQDFDSARCAVIGSHVEHDRLDGTGQRVESRLDVVPGVIDLARFVFFEGFDVVHAYFSSSPKGQRVLGDAVFRGAAVVGGIVDETAFARDEFVNFLFNVVHGVVVGRRVWR